MLITCCGPVPARPQSEQLPWVSAAWGCCAPRRIAGCGAAMSMSEAPRPVHTLVLEAPRPMTCAHPPRGCRHLRLCLHGLCSSAMLFVVASYCLNAIRLLVVSMDADRPAVMPRRSCLRRRTGTEKSMQRNAFSLKERSISTHSQPAKWYSRTQSSTNTSRKTKTRLPCLKSSPRAEILKVR